MDANEAQSAGQKEEPRRATNLKEWNHT